MDADIDGVCSLATVSPVEGIVHAVRTVTTTAPIQEPLTDTKSGCRRTSAPAHGCACLTVTTAVRARMIVIQHGKTVGRVLDV